MINREAYCIHCRGYSTYRIFQFENSVKTDYFWKKFLLQNYVLFTLTHTNHLNHIHLVIYGSYGEKELMLKYVYSYSKLQYLTTLSVDETLFYYTLHAIFSKLDF
jgi:hypothetical protein